MANPIVDLMIRIRAQYAEVTKAVEQVKGSMSELKDKVGTAGKQLAGQLKTAFSGISKTIEEMDGMFGTLLRTGIKVFQGLVTGVKTFAKAMLATGIGAVIIAITTALMGLAAAFKRSGEASDAIKVGLAFLKGILEFLIGLLVKVGENLVKAFKDPKQAIKDLWTTIKEGFVSRFQGFVNIFVKGWEVIKNGALGVALAIKGIFDKDAREKSKQYFEDMKQSLLDMGNAATQALTGKTFDEILDGVKNITAGIKENGKAMQEVERMEQQYRDAKIKSVTTLARYEASLAEIQTKIAEENGKTEESRQARLALINQEMELQNQIAAVNLDLAAKNLALVKARQSVQAGTNEEDRMELAQAEADFINAQTAARKVQNQLISQQTKMEYGLGVIEAKNNKQTEADIEKLRSLDEQYQLSRTNNEIEYAALQTKFAKEAEIREAQKIEDADARAKAIALIEETYWNNGMKEARAAFEANKELQREQGAELVSQLAQQQEAILDSEKSTYKERLAALQELNNLKLINEEEYQAAVTQLRMDEGTKYADAALQTLDIISQFQTAAMNRELEAAGDNEEKKDAIRKKYAKKQKTIAIIQAIINGALGVTKAFADLGPIAGAIAAALVAASTVAQIAVIKSQPLAKGGLAYGETLATIGEYPGAASNPEVVAPLSELKKIIQPSFEPLKPILNSLAQASMAAWPLSVIEASRAMTGIAALKTGGIAYGKSLATVGEYPGASTNPEVIAPLDRLKKLLEPAKGPYGEVRFVIEQEQLVGILERANKKKIYF